MATRRLLIPKLAVPDAAMWGNSSLQRVTMSVAFVAIAIAFATGPIANSFRPGDHNKDYDNWFVYGQKVVHGEALYPEDEDEYCPYIYPPTSAVFLFAPLSVFGKPAFVTILVLANAATWYLALYFSLKLFADPSRPRSPLLIALPFMATIAFVYDTFLLGQINLALLLLMLAMFAAIRRRRPWLAGGMLALATAIKAFPFAAIVYLVWRRQWRAAAATIVWLFVILIVLPAPFRGFDRNVHELRLWYRDMLADQSGNSVGQRKDIGYTFKNQSLTAVVHRVTRPVIAGDRNRKFFFVNVVNLTPKQAQLVAYGLIACLGLIYVCCMPAASRQTPATVRIEQAMLLIMIVVCSPLAWTYFYCWTLPAWIVIVDVLTDDKLDPAIRRRGWWLLGTVGVVMASA